MNIRVNSNLSPTRSGLQTHRRRILIGAYLALMLFMVLKAEQELEMNPAFRDFNVGFLHLVISAILLDLVRDSSTFVAIPHNQKPIAGFFMLVSGLSFALALKYLYSAFCVLS